MKIEELLLLNQCESSKRDTRDRGMASDTGRGQVHCFIQYFYTKNTHEYNWIMCAPKLTFSTGKIN